MGASLAASSADGLERLCDRRDRIVLGPDAPGLQRLQAHLHGQPFAPHRHDSYAIGITVAGVQRFRYRGAVWHCLPGQCHVLHPDELHDGAAATEAGFGYRILYIDPALVQHAQGGRPLPFAGDPVLDARRLPPGFAAAAWDMQDPIETDAGVDLVVAIATMLEAPSTPAARPAALALDRLLRVRDAIAASPDRPHPAAWLEQLSGLDRWTLARQFRAAFGTSPSRFRTMRQLDRVRRLLRAGTSLAEAAVAAGFADQSHMSRRFKRGYGLTPARWVAVSGVAGGAATVRR